mmetsp:Transcript_13070/g.25142  ORF Transcript_13070/g.25142 Transcript_13070/m.25142 type:complete len:249 (-) Transcript_13070:1715-2461(-)
MRTAWTWMMMMIIATKTRKCPTHPLLPNPRHPSSPWRDVANNCALHLRGGGSSSVLPNPRRTRKKNPNPPQLHDPRRVASSCGHARPNPRRKRRKTRKSYRPKRNLSSLVLLGEGNNCESPRPRIPRMTLMRTKMRIPKKNCLTMMTTTRKKKSRTTRRRSRQRNLLKNHRLVPLVLLLPKERSLPNQTRKFLETTKSVATKKWNWTKTIQKPSFGAMRTESTSNRCPNWNVRLFWPIVSKSSRPSKT